MVLRSTFVPKILQHETKYFQKDKKVIPTPEYHEENEKFNLPIINNNLKIKLPSMEELLQSLSQQK